MREYGDDNTILWFWPYSITPSKLLTAQDFIITIFVEFLSQISTCHRLGKIFIVMLFRLQKNVFQWNINYACQTINFLSYSFIPSPPYRRNYSFPQVSFCWKSVFPQQKWERGLWKVPIFKRWGCVLKLIHTNIHIH